jgi:UTP--glucose-1-phosphate uridylyltransferase
VGEEPFAVLLGDGLIAEAEVLLTTMMEVQQKTGGSVIALTPAHPGRRPAEILPAITVSLFRFSL